MVLKERKGAKIPPHIWKKCACDDCQRSVDLCVDCVNMGLYKSPNSYEYREER